MKINSFKVLTLIAEQGLSKEKFCHRAGIQESTFRTVMNGRRVPRLQTIHKIADALGVPASDILERSEK
jgi:transcriptional regulator with XRE-family HTH domain